MHMFAWFLNLKKFIHQVNIGTKWSLHKHPRAVCQVDIISCTKWTHLKNSKVRGSLERWPNDDHFLSFCVLADTFPQRESAKMATLLVSETTPFSLLLMLLFLPLLLVLLLLLLLLFNHLLISCPLTSSLQEPSGTQKTDDHFSHVLSADTIGLVRFLYTCCSCYNQSLALCWITGWITIPMCQGLINMLHVLVILVVDAPDEMLRQFRVVEQVTKQQKTHSPESRDIFLYLFCYTAGCTNLLVEAVYQQWCFFTNQRKISFKTLKPL